MQTTYEHTKAYGGNAYFTETNIGANSATTTLPAGTYLSQNRGYGIVSADRQSYIPTPFPNVTSISNSQAAYLQDSYTPTDGLTVNFGLRWEGQHLGVKDSPDAPFIDLKSNWAPRVQAIYDWTKQGRSKVSANWGRFYENIPLDIGDRAFGLERGYTSWRGPTSGAGSCTTLGNPGVINGNGAGSPNGCEAILNAYKSSTRGLYTYGVTGGSTEPVAPNLKGQYGDAFGAAVEYEVISDLSVGVEYTGRRVGEVIEDLSTDDGTTYFIANPGTGKPFDDGTGYIIDPKSATAVDPITGATYTTPFPKPVRDYDAFTVSMRKAFSAHWQGMASYTYSSLRGNYPGLFSATNGQNDPNLTSMFDLASLLSNQTGPLPADSPHQFKVYGSYSWDFGPQWQFTAGTAIRLESGTPVNMLGAHPTYGQSEAFVLQRGSGGRTPWLNHTDLNGQVSYVIKPPYAVKFTIQVTNIFNKQTAVSVDEDWTYDSVPAIGSAGCSSHSAVSKGDKIGAALAQCPALGYLRTTDGLPATINTNWGQATSYTAPLGVRLGLQFTF
jgi:hypothetical protein